MDHASTAGVSTPATGSRFLVCSHAGASAPKHPGNLGGCFFLAGSLWWGHQGPQHPARPAQCRGPARPVNEQKCDGAPALMMNDWAWHGEPHPFLCAFNQPSWEDASGLVPDDRIPGRMRSTEELRDCQRDESEEAQGVGRLSGSPGKGGDTGVPPLMSLASFTSCSPERHNSP